MFAVCCGGRGERHTAHAFFEFGLFFLDRFLRLDSSAIRYWHWLVNGGHLKSCSKSSFPHHLFRISISNLDHFAEMEFEKVFPELCCYGKYQRLIFWFVLLPVQLSYYCHIYSHLFVTYQPHHWCQFNDHLSIPTMQLFKNQSSIDLFQSTLPANLNRYFFIPSIELLHQLDSNDSSLNMNQFVSTFNYSLANYIDSISSCHAYNATMDQLANFHHRFFQLYSSLANAKYQSNQDSVIEYIINVPTIVPCVDGWAFNRSLLGRDESFVTKVSRFLPNKNTVYFGIFQCKFLQSAYLHLNWVEKWLFWHSNVIINF